ncbi:MAG TPA: peptidyl-alpha-hydroxyglycine alpha-amidating lyase family protein [Terriglobia bacterium]|nr:peptidyl-alpha-hydroxyglycine alpha-amidating lyase family protein [Terriglobia bacterium]
MKYRCFWLCLLIAVPVFAQQGSPPEIPFDSVPNVIKLPPDLYLGEVSGVALNSKGHIFIYTRSGETLLLEFDATGKFLRRIGKGLYAFSGRSFAHVVRVDAHDNIWCVDEGSNMVIEFNPAGRVMLLLGRKPEPSEGPAPAPSAAPPPAALAGNQGSGSTGPYGLVTFNRPTDVAWDAAGNIFVSDGYGNSRVVKFSEAGDLVKTWGSKGSRPGQFRTPHSIAVDAKGNVYVADRGNKRIQVFDNDGNYLREFTSAGTPWAICITPGPEQFLYSSDAQPGRIYKLDLNGQLLGEFGSFGHALKQFGWVHEMDCSQGNKNVLYVGELLNWRVQKLILHPAPQNN